ncbi:MAG: hypothetical protein MN733_16200, partial [Nitrososphaera sp.]|nr:hypothetical protein [Nitrososphaera sp.]
MNDINRTRERIAGAFADIGLELKVANDIAFHMTDWKEDIEDLIGIYEQIEQLSDEQIRRIIFRFLAHVPNHVAAAKKLVGLGPIEDVFNVGVLEED